MDGGPAAPGKRATGDQTADAPQTLAARQAAEQTRQRAEELEKAMDLVPAAVWVARDPDCHIIIGNREANRFYEACEQDNVSAGPAPDTKNVTRRFFRGGRELPPDELPMQQAAALGIEVRDAEVDVLQPSGKSITLLGSASPLRDAGGQIRSAVAAFVDITERKRAEQELARLNASLEQQVDEHTTQLQSTIAQLRREIDERTKTQQALAESEAMFRTVAEQSPNMIFINHRGRVVYANPKCVEVMGYTRDEFYAPNLDFRCLIAPESRDVVEAGYRRHLVGAPVDAIEYALITKRGTRLDVLMTSTLMDYAGEKAILGIVTDVTEQRRMHAAVRESEHKYRALAEKVSDIPYSMTAQGVVTYIGPQVVHCGFQPEDIIGAAFQEFVLPEDRNHTMAEFQRFLATGEEFLSEFRVQSRDGRVHWMESHAALHRDEQGNPLGTTGVLRDITERKDLEKALTDLSAQERRRFGQDLHDGLGQELAGLACLAACLQKSCRTREAPSLELVDKLVDRIQHAIDSSRTIAKGLIPVEIDAFGLVVALEQLAARAESSSGITCDFRCTTPVVIEDDTTATELFRIAQEALSNATRHARACRMEIELAGDEHRVVLTVRDDGVGLPADLTHSSGMGLRIMRYRAGRIGATLDIGSVGGGGTEITCSVPRTAHPNARCIPPALQ